MAVHAPVTPLLALKNILFATDFSPCSQAAMPYLRTLAGLYGSTVHVVHVVAPEMLMELPLDLPPELDADRNTAKDKLKELLRAKPFGDDVACTATVERGLLWEVLSKVIEERKIDLIAVGTHGRRGLSKMVLGSVAEKILRHAPCPVLTVGPECIKVPATPNTFLLATDFSPRAQHTVDYALALAQGFRARLVVVHAVPGVGEISPQSYDAGPAAMELACQYAEESLADARRQAAELLPMETKRELRSEISVEFGDAAQLILSKARSEDADLILLGAHHAGGAASHLPWTTAHAVICRASCPVLAIPN